eukprot:6486545-Amphidinium_carterae.1
MHNKSNYVRRICLRNEARKHVVSKLRTLAPSVLDVGCCMNECQSFEARLKSDQISTVAVLLPQQRR